MSETEEQIMFENGKTKFRVKIKHFRMKMYSFEPEEFIKSTSFEAHDGKSSIHLRIYPNGSRYDYRGNVF